MPINLSTVDMQKKWKQQISEAKKNFKKERLQQEFSAVIKDVGGYKSHLQKQVQTRTSQLEEQLKNIASPKEPQRKLDVETVTLLNYYSKVIQSKIALQGDTQEGFYKVLQEFANHEDKNMRWALMDSFHDVMDAGRSLMSRIEPGLTTALSKATSDSAEAFESKLREQYTIAKNSFKSPAELKQEEENKLAKSSAESELFSLKFELTQAENALDEVVLGYQRDGQYFTGDAGEESNPYFS